LFNPASLGYSLVFNGTFGNPGDIDLANTSAPGFKWYFCRANQSATPVPASDFSVASNGVLTITPTVGEPNNAQLCSAIPVKTPPLWVGNAFSGGWYIEYSIAFDNTTLNLPSGAQWPAVWAMPVEKIIAGANTTLPPTGIQWPGQASGFAHFIENDMFEYNTGITNGWDATVIDWQGVFGVFDSYLKCAGFCGVQNQNHFITLPSVKWTSFNTFGQLWIPGTAANNYQGSVTNYFNGIKVSSGVTWTSQGVGTPGMITNPPTGTFTWSAMDGLTYYIILGTGHTTPLQVQWVHVWQKP
jgi:hypothetical protein